MGWLRAAVLGANDGVISTASLIVGVASASSGRAQVLTAALAGAAAGAMAMAAGEYVSVSSQADSERADLAREARALHDHPTEETDELVTIYRERGLSLRLARKVARQLMAEDALGAHARDELGLTEAHAARPLQAALASALTFVAGASLPTAAFGLSPSPSAAENVVGATILGLLTLGALGAKAGGASPLKPALRVAFCGLIALVVTAGVGLVVGHAL
jgi:VIT1/CCC1 family predicted Fe2+/Mn2+ transporter